MLLQRMEPKSALDSYMQISLRELFSSKKEEEEEEERWESALLASVGHLEGRKVTDL